MAKRKPVESADAPKAPTPAVAPVAAEPKKSVRKTASTPKSAATSAAHKHHSKKVVQAVAEAPIATLIPAVVAPMATPVAAEVTPEQAAPVALTHEAIALLAYSYWEARGYQGGSPEQDWLQAEQELLKLA